MKNFIAIMDKDGNFSAPEWVIKALTGLDKFIGSSDHLEDIVMEMENNGIGPGHMEFIREYSERYYTAWLASSTELTNKIGFFEICKIFSLLKRVYFIAWPSEMQDIEEMHTGDIEIFRGESLSSFESGTVGLSWTTNEGIARTFQNGRSDGVLLKGIISKENVWAYFSAESEVVALCKNIECLDKSIVGSSSNRIKIPSNFKIKQWPT